MWTQASSFKPPFRVHTCHCCAKGNYQSLYPQSSCASVVLLYQPYTVGYTRYSICQTASGYLYIDLWWINDPGVNTLLVILCQANVCVSLCVLIMSSRCQRFNIGEECQLLSFRYLALTVFRIVYLHIFCGMSSCKPLQCFCLFRCKLLFTVLFC